MTQALQKTTSDGDEPRRQRDAGGESVEASHGVAPAAALATKICPIEERGSSFGSAYGLPGFGRWQKLHEPSRLTVELIGIGFAVLQEPDLERERQVGPLRLGDEEVAGGVRVVGARRARGVDEEDLHALGAVRVRRVGLEDGAGDGELVVARRAPVGVTQDARLAGAMLGTLRHARVLAAEALDLLVPHGIGAGDEQGARRRARPA